MKLTKPKLDELIKEQMARLAEAGEVIDLAAAREEKEDEEERQGMLEIVDKLDKVERYMAVLIELVDKTIEEIEINKFYSEFRQRFRGEIEAMDLITELMHQWIRDVYPRDFELIQERRKLADETWVNAREEESRWD